LAACTAFSFASAIARTTATALALRYVEAVNDAYSGRGVGAIIMLFPDYKVSAFGAEVLGNQLGPALAKLMVRKSREFKPENELHRSRWTTKHRSESLHELMLVTRSAKESIDSTRTFGSDSP
jgi:hypothetical protein